MRENDERILGRISDQDLLLKVGGWTCPLDRSGWLFDAESYETRGYYACIGFSRYQGGRMGTLPSKRGFPETRGPICRGHSKL